MAINYPGISGDSRPNDDYCGGKRLLALVTRRPRPRHSNPDSDGAGEVVAIGSHATRFKPTDRVIVVYYPNFPYGTALTHAQTSGSPGSDKSGAGTFRHHGVFSKNGGLIHMPANLSYREAATLPCSALTA